MPARPATRHSAVFLAALGLAACANDPSASTRAAQETAAMTTPDAPAARMFSPRLDAAQSLLRLLDLVRDAGSIGDIDAERLRKTFGVAFAADGGRLGFGERLTQDWWSSFELDPANADGARFEFSFRPDPPGAHPPMSAICAVDFDRFAGELQAMGFRRETYRGEHNRVIHDLFQRGAMTVTVYTRGEADQPPEKITHACVSMVLIR